jgi:dynein heavy chain
MEFIPNAKKKREDIKNMFKKYIPGTLLYIKKNCKLLVPVAPISMVESLCKILEIILRD